jgi:hypothetical protein
MEVRTGCGSGIGMERRYCVRLLLNASGVLTEWDGRLLAVLMGEWKPDGWLGMDGLEVGLAVAVQV